MFDKTWNLGTPLFRAAERRVTQALDRPSSNCYLSKDSGHAVIELLLPGYSKENIEVSLRKVSNAATQQLHVVGEITDVLGSEYAPVAVGFTCKPKFTYTTDLPISASVQSVTLKNGLLRILITDFEQVSSKTIIPVPVQD